MERGDCQTVKIVDEHVRFEDHEDIAATPCAKIAQIRRLRRGIGQDPAAQGGTGNRRGNAVEARQFGGDSALDFGEVEPLPGDRFAIGTGVGLKERLYQFLADAEASLEGLDRRPPVKTSGIEVMRLPAVSLLRPAAANCSYQCDPICSLILSTIALMLNDPGFWLGGYSMKLCPNFAAEACIGTRM